MRLCEEVDDSPTYDLLCRSNVDNVTFEVENYDLHSAYKSNDSGITQILVQPQDTFASKNDIVAASAMESFLVDVKVCLQSKRVQRIVEKLMHLGKFKKTYSIQPTYQYICICEDH
jgi:hypothetical protein